LKLISELKSTPKPNKTRFYIFAVIGFLSALTDLLITYIGSPGLELEANPLITVFGLGWSALIIANIIVYAFFLIFIYIAFVKYKRTVIQCDGFRQFMSMLYFDRPDKYIWLWYKFPKGKVYRLFAPMGYAIAYVFPILRLIAISGWLMFLSGTELCIFCLYGLPHIYFMHMEVIVLAIIGILLLTVLISYWYSKEYRINKKALALINAEKEAEPEIKPVTMAEVKQIPEQEARLDTDLEAKITAEYEADLKAEWEGKLKAELEEKLSAEFEIKINAVIEEKLNVEMVASQRAEEEAKQKADLEAKLNAEIEARQRAELEARQNVEFEENLRFEIEAKLRAENEARYKAEQEARQKAEDEARQRAELRAERKVRSENKKAAKLEAKQMAEIEARQKDIQAIESAGWSSAFSSKTDESNTENK